MHDTKYKTIRVIVIYGKHKQNDDPLQNKQSKRGRPTANVLVLVLKLIWWWNP